MDRVLVFLVAVVLLLSHMAAYHLGGIKACDSIEKALKEVKALNKEVK